MRVQPPRDFTLVDMARAFSVAAHTAVNQKRKYTGEDYHHHPEEVLQILMTYCDPSAEEQAAALLHDVIEDTATAHEHIAQVFGQTVARLVTEVSDVSVKSDGNRAKRKAIDCAHLHKASREGMRLKCADIISNTRSIAQHDITFARVYVEEIFAIIKGFVKIEREPIYVVTGQRLMKVANEIITDRNEFFQLINKYVQVITWAEFEAVYGVK